MLHKQQATNRPPPGFERVREDSDMFRQTDDPYKGHGKLPEPTVCRQCHAVYEKGRWRWGEAPPDANPTICPACDRINDQYPAGFVTLEGDFLHSHGEDILHMIRNVEQRQKTEHPLQRLMSLEHPDDRLDITTTDIHLARAIGDAIHDAYQGELELQYNREDQLLRVHWRRD